MAHRRTSKFRVGDEVWLPCRVRPGPFPNERKVYVKVGESEWFGFVDVSQLRENAVPGTSYVRALVIAVQPSNVVLGIRGQSPASGPLQATPSQLTEHGSLAT
jgi:hypothetical protein